MGGDGSRLDSGWPACRLVGLPGWHRTARAVRRSGHRFALELARRRSVRVPGLAVAVLELGAVELAVAAAGGEQLVVGAPLDDAAVLDDEDERRPGGWWRGGGR